MSNTTFNEELYNVPFSDELLFNNEYPVDESARSYMKESYDKYVDDYNKKEAAVLFNNTHVEYDSCDCGEGYGCSHGGWPFRIRFLNNDKVCEGDFEDEHSLILTGTKNCIRIEDYTKITMLDFVTMCELCGINLEHKYSTPTSPKEVKSAEEIFKENYEKLVKANPNDKFYDWDDPETLESRNVVITAMKQYASQLHPVSKSEGVRPVPKEKAIDLITGALPDLNEYLTVKKLDTLCKWIDSYLDKYTAQFSAQVSKDALTQAEEPTASDITSLFKNQKQ